MKADSQLLPALHDDVVYEIFKFLSLAERKNARLVCKQWHRVSNRQIFVKNEAFFISNMYQIRSVVDVLVKCQRNMLNLKFDQRLFGKNSNILWHRCGPRIQSLNFNMCRFPPTIVETIFIQCTNLNEFTAYGGGIVGLCFFTENLPREKSILQIKRHVVRPNLRILHLDSLALALRECDLRLISSAFPRLTNLRIQLLLSDDKEIHCAPNFTVLLNLLDSEFKSLEILHMEFPYYYAEDPIDFNNVTQPNLDRLKSVSMSLNPFILRGDSFNKILRFKFWTSLKLSWFHTSETDITVVTRLINENPLLEELDLFVILSTISHFTDLFEVLVKSRLKTLKIETSDSGWSLGFTQFFITTAISSFEGLPCNDTVESLAVNSKSSAEFSSLFVEYFRNVRELWVRPGNVNTVFKYQKNLRSLKIEPLGEIQTDEPLHSTIESLELMDIRPLIIDVFKTYKFPNLRYLVVDESKVYYEKIQRLTTRAEENLFEIANADVNEENEELVVSTPNDFKAEELTDTFVFIEKMNALMLCIFRKSPHLEAIEFESDYSLNVEAFTVFFQSCLHFHQLRYVSFYSFSPFVDKIALKREVAKYFKKCPSFRGLWFGTLKLNIFFHFNIITKKCEFSHEHSYAYFPEGYFFGIHLHEFWRHKR